MSAYLYNPPDTLVTATPAAPATTGGIELGFVLDASGSMASCTSTVIESFNALLESQKKDAPASRVSVVVFNNSTELFQDGVPLYQVNPSPLKSIGLRAGPRSMTLLVNS